MKSSNVMHRIATTMADTRATLMASVSSSRHCHNCTNKTSRAQSQVEKPLRLLPDLSSCSEDIKQPALSTDLQNQARVAGAEGVSPSGRIP